MDKMGMEQSLPRCYVMVYNGIYRCRMLYNVTIEGSLEAKLPTIWTEGQASQPRRRSEMEKIRREQMQVRDSRETLCLLNVLWLRRVEK